MAPAPLLSQAGRELHRKRWACALRLCQALPRLETLKLLEISVDLRMLRERVGVLSARTMRQATRHEDECAKGPADRHRAHHGAPKRSIDMLTSSFHNEHATHHDERQRMSRRIYARESLQLVGAMWALFHSPRLASADLSGLMDEGCSWPAEAVRAIGTAIRLGAPALRWVKLHVFAIPIDVLRRVSPSRPGADLARSVQGAVCDFRSLRVAPMDLVLLCHACGDMAHVTELEFSRNPLGNAGLLAFTNELGSAPSPTSDNGAGARSLAAHLPAPSPPGMAPKTTPARQLANLRVLVLNGCQLGDESFVSFFGAVHRHTLFPILEHLSCVDNELGNDSLAALSVAVKGGSFENLLHLNLGSNDVADEGCEGLARAFECGGLARLIHLSLARNQVGVHADRTAENCRRKISDFMLIACRLHAVCMLIHLAPCAARWPMGGYKRSHVVFGRPAAACVSSTLGWATTCLAT